MNASIYILGAMMSPGSRCAVGQSLRCTRFHSFAAGGSAPVPAAPAATAVPVTATPVGSLIAPEDVQDNSGLAPGFTPAVGYAPARCDRPGDAGLSRAIMPLTASPLR